MGSTSSVGVLKRAWYRIYQFGFNLGKYCLIWPWPQLLSGAGSVRELPELIASHGVSKPLVVTGPNITKRCLPDGLYAALRERGIECEIYSKTEANPSIENVEEALELYIAGGCDGIIAFGGGSPMDCAKAVGARVVNPKKNVSAMAGFFKVGRKLPPFFAVPTTAGTGSETTIAAVITDRKLHRKFAIGDLRLLPLVAVLDCELTAQLPANITAATGMDALTHAVEAYVNQWSGATDEASVEAIELVFQYLPRAYTNGQDFEAREKMLVASYKAGIAFTRSCVGYVHAIAHTLGGFYGLAHGLANAVLLPVVLELYGKSAHAPLAKLADAVHLAGETEAQKAQAFIEAIRSMNAAMGIPNGFDCIRDEDMPTMVRYALAEANPTYPVPEIWGEREIRAAIDRIRI